ncbi:hypothetical protein [Marmoricola sp. RAF53]
MIQAAILERLERQSDTAGVMAKDFGLTPDCVRHHLDILRAEGAARPCTSRKVPGKRAPNLLWELGDSDMLGFAIGGVWSRAVQIGMERDPLVAALFGPAASAGVAQ